MNGACKYCGQIYMVPDGCEDPDYEATKACNCDGASWLRKLEDNIMTGKSNVILICDDEAVRSLLNHAIDLARDGKFKQMSHTDNNGVKYTVKMKNDGTFKITKAVTKTESIE